MAGTCSIDGCTRPSKSRGMCNKDYERWRRSGADGVQLRQHRPPGLDDAAVLDFIMSRTERDGERLVWQGAVNSTGYGTLLHKNRTWVVHTLVLTLSKGERPDGMEGCHDLGCVSRCCVNPDHLRWDTRTANAHDTRRLQRVSGQKLTHEAVREIRRLAGGGVASEALADQFKVTRRHINKILGGQVWQAAT